MQVLLTNDDGIDADGLQALRRALLEVEGVELAVIAPDGNRSAIGRGITTRRPLVVERVGFPDGTHGYATDGTPVDCVRLASLGLIDGFTPEVVVAGINHGANLGDDVTYSGTVAAAMEGLVLGVPAVAVSQQSLRREMDFRLGQHFDFDAAARFAARIVEGIEDVPLPPSTLLNVNVPACPPDGLEVCRLGKRIYRDRLQETGVADAQRDGGGPRTYWIYGADPDFEDEPGTDLAAVHAGRIAVTPLHLDLTHHDGIGPLSTAQLDRLLAPAVSEFE
jgi:5'-nucleotidase